MIIINTWIIYPSQLFQRYNHLLSGNVHFGLINAYN